jgi:NifU-like protein involved in Fe-S cluster formation
MGVWSVVAGVGLLIVVAGGWFLVHYWLSPGLKEPDGTARITGKCGDTMEMGLQFDRGIVVKSSHWTDGCTYSFNCGLAAANLAKGKTAEALFNIDADMIQQAIGGLPTDYRHCAELAAQTLHAAADDYLRKGSPRPGGCRLNSGG